MIIESFVKSSLLPAFFLSLLCLSTGFLKGRGRDIAQGLLFAGALVIGLYQIKGGYGDFFAGGTEALLLVPIVYLVSLPALFLTRFNFLIRALFIFVTVWLLCFPLLGSRVSLDLESETIRYGLSFGLLALCLWSFSQRQFEKGWWASLVVACLVAWGASAVFFLFKGSALISQCFGLFATVSGVLFGVAVFFGWRLSALVASAYLVSLPVLFLLAGVLYLEVTALRVMALCLPFLIVAIRPLLPFSRGGAIKEAFISGILCALSVTWVIYETYVSSDPLY